MLRKYPYPVFGSLITIASAAEAAEVLRGFYGVAEAMPLRKPPPQHLYSLREDFIHCNGSKAAFYFRMTTIICAT